MTADLSVAERLKFYLLAEGLVISPEAQAYITVHNGERPLTPADYASTSGVILELDGDVWVNAPVEDHNPNFVSGPESHLRLDDAGLYVESGDLVARARFWLPPRYHGEFNAGGEAFNSYAFTHADRVRISPIEGCAITCTFCDLPYEFRYRTKRVEGLVDAVRVAVTDPVQPARHVLISGGTPREEDYGYVREVYAETLGNFPDLAVDIMMVPVEGLLDVAELARLGVAGLSVNLEIWNRDIARRVMRKKYEQGLDHYLGFLETAAEQLGGARVRSMLMVGLEPAADTLAGVREIARRGCVPVLSPFRPDPSTPLRALQPPSAQFMQDVFMAAREITDSFGVTMGPPCVPCSHNTLTSPVRTKEAASSASGRPNVV